MIEPFTPGWAVFSERPESHVYYVSVYNASGECSDDIELDHFPSLAEIEDLVELHTPEEQP